MTTAPVTAVTEVSATVIGKVAPTVAGVAAASRIAAGITSVERTRLTTEPVGISAATAVQAVLSGVISVETAAVMVIRATAAASRIIPGVARITCIATVSRAAEKQAEKAVATAITIITHCLYFPFSLVKAKVFPLAHILLYEKARPIVSTAHNSFESKLNYLPKYLFKSPAKPAP